MGNLTTHREASQAGMLIPPKPVQARYVKYKVTPARTVSITEVQVLESIKYKPFDLKVALPDGTDRSDISKYNPKHTPSKPYRPRR